MDNRTRWALCLTAALISTCAGFTGAQAWETHVAFAATGASIDRAERALISLKDQSTRPPKPPKLGDPWVAMMAQVVHFTGPDPVECGQHRDDRDLGEQLNHPLKDEAELKKSLQCVQMAAEHHLPFWTAKGRMGIDTFGITGLLGQRDGSIHLFNFCFGQYCSPEFSLRWCLVPDVRTSPNGSAGFYCAKWAAGGSDARLLVRLK
jgi:hypothetical protein